MRAKANENEKLQCYEPSVWVRQLHNSGGLQIPHSMPLISGMQSMINWYSVLGMRFDSVTYVTFVLTTWQVLLVSR